MQLANLILNSLELIVLLIILGAAFKANKKESTLIKGTEPGEKEYNG